MNSFVRISIVSKLHCVRLYFGAVPYGARASGGEECTHTLTHVHYNTHVYKVTAVRLRVDGHTIGRCKYTCTVRSVSVCACVSVPPSGFPL